MFGLIKRLLRPKPARPLYALLLQQQQTGIVVQAIGPDVPLADAEQMLKEALASIEQQKQLVMQRGRRP
jgi:hypothetical protein